MHIYQNDVLETPKALMSDKNQQEDTTSILIFWINPFILQYLVESSAYHKDRV